MKKTVPLASLTFKILFPLFSALLIAIFAVGLVFRFPWYISVLFFVAGVLLGGSCYIIFRIRLEADTSNKVITYYNGLKIQRIMFKDIKQFEIDDYSFLRNTNNGYIKSYKSANDISITVNFTSRKIRKELRALFEELLEKDNVGKDLSHLQE